LRKYIFLIINLIACALFLKTQSSYGQESFSRSARLQVDLSILDIPFTHAGMGSHVKNEDLVWTKRKYLHDLNTRDFEVWRRDIQIVLEFKKDEFFLGTNRAKAEQSIPATIRFTMDFLAQSLWGWNDNDFSQ